MRGMGDGKTPLKFITVACIVNLILDLAFVKELHMGGCGRGGSHSHCPGAFHDFLCNLSYT